MRPPSIHALAACALALCAAACGASSRGAESASEATAAPIAGGYVFELRSEEEDACSQSFAFVQERARLELDVDARGDARLTLSREQSEIGGAQPGAEDAGSRSTFQRRTRRRFAWSGRVERRDERWVLPLAPSACAPDEEATTGPDRGTCEEGGALELTCEPSVIVPDAPEGAGEPVSVLACAAEAAHPERLGWVIPREPLLFHAPPGLIREIQRIQEDIRARVRRAEASDAAR